MEALLKNFNRLKTERATRCPLVNCNSQRVEKVGRIGQESSFLMRCLICRHNWVAKTNSKMKNISCKCLVGRIHKSRLEATHCDKIHLMAKDPAYKIKAIHHEKGYDLIVKGKKMGRHYPDFTLELKGNKIKIIESKGKETDLWRIKRNLFLVCYPKIPYEVWK